MLKQVRPAIVSMLLITVLTGFLYPLAVTGIAQVLFPYQANGSVIPRDGKPGGSALIGQSFDDPKYFWGRLSATSPVPYAPFFKDTAGNLTGSSGSNFGPMNPGLIDPDPTKGSVAGRIKALKDADAALGVKNSAPVPVDLVTASASGLDPHISPAAAEYQVARVARARKITEQQVRDLVHQHTQDRQLGFLGEPRVNVLELNLALDSMR